MSTYLDTINEYKDSIQAWSNAFKAYATEVMAGIKIWSQQTRQAIRSNLNKFADFFSSKNLRQYFTWGKQLAAEWAQYGYELASRGIKSVQYFGQQTVNFIIRGFRFAWNVIVTGFVKGYRFIIDNAKNLYELARHLGKALKQFGIQLWNTIKRIPKAIKKAVSYLLKALKQLGIELWNTIKRIPNAIKEALSYLLNQMTRLMKGLKRVLIRTIKALWLTIKNIPAQLHKALKITWNFIQKLTHDFMKVLRQGWQFIKTLPHQIVEAIKATWTYLKNLANHFVLALKQIYHALKAVAQQMIIAVKQAWVFLKATIEHGKRLLIEGLKALRTVIKELPKHIVEGVKAVARALKSFAKDVLEMLRTLAQNFWRQINVLVEAIGRSAKAITSFVLDKVAAVVGMLYGCSYLLVDAMSQLVPEHVKSVVAPYIALDTLHTGATIAMTSFLAAGLAFATWRIGKFAVQKAKEFGSHLYAEPARRTNRPKPTLSARTPEFTHGVNLETTHPITPLFQQKRTSRGPATTPRRSEKLENLKRNVLRY